MKRIYLLTLPVFLFVVLSVKTGFAQNSDKKLIDYVNPLIGTESTYELSHGNLYPAIALPWAMNFWTPQTGKMGSGWIYYSKADSICGIRQTHQPSPWINDYAAFSIMPVNGELKLKESERKSLFSHDKETVRPNYYSVQMETYGIKAEITPTERAASFRITYPANMKNYLIIDAFDKGSEVLISPDKKTITGICRNNHGGVPQNFAGYFIIKFDQPFESFGTWTDGAVSHGNKKASGKHTMAYVQFTTGGREAIITFSASSSFININQASLNLQKEIGRASFEDIKKRGEAAWNDQLSRIVVEGGSELQKSTFYSCLYRTLLFPRKFYETDKKGRTVHYSPYDGKVHEGYMFTDNGFWDTFRAVHPFFTLMYPEVSAQIMQGLLNTYSESGWLPEWASPGHRNCMIGNHSISLLTDAWMKGIRSFDKDKALEAMIHQANGQGPVTSVGRNGFNEYNKLGYVPYPQYKEATAKTLEYAYNDWCISQFAKSTGKNEIALEYEKRAMNYKNVWDASTGFMRGRKTDGSWLENFDPVEWGGPFTEGNSWHYTWSVFHDIEGLSNLIGGHRAMAEKLDAVFTSANTVKVGTYGEMIHEMTEMVNANMGQYAHGNQPIQHMIYLYDYAGEPWKTQKWARFSMEKLYKPAPDGYCGDEDNGQTSAWYVLSAMGMYPVCPGSTQYITGSPLFNKITLSLKNGKKFIISADNNSDKNIYIQSAMLNNSQYNKTYLEYSDITKGGTLNYKMADEPNKSWGTAGESLPYSFSRK